MSFRSVLCIALLATALPAVAGPLLSRPALMEAARESATDNISSGWCGRGIFSILNNAGLGSRLQPGNGQDWEKILLKAGWKPVQVTSPLRAPLGSVLVYLGDARVGKTPRGTPGGYYGHVEMVALGKAGQRLYVADCPRVKPGGSVPDNFTGRAWVPPGQVLAKAVAIEEQVNSVLEERTKMAFEHFRARKDASTPMQLTEVSRPVDPAN